MNIGRIEDGQLILPTAEQQKKVTITNPSEEILKCVLGMKDIVYWDKPEYDPATQCLREVPTEAEDHIEVVYEVAELPEEDLMEAAGSSAF